MKTISLKDAVALIPDGASVMIGGFMGVGTPERVVEFAERGAHCKQPKGVADRVQRARH